MSKKTITVCIGNTDKKLSPEKWGEFISDTAEIIRASADAIYFFGMPPANAPWQNCCWVFETNSDLEPVLRRSLTALGANYSQDAVAYITGTTEFL